MRDIQDFFRILRMITFVGASYIFVYIVLGVPLEYFINIALNPSSFKDYFYSFNLLCLIGYPILFLLSVIYLKIHYGEVTLVHSTTHSVGLWSLFKQNEIHLLGNIVFDIKENVIFKDNTQWLNAWFIGFDGKKGKTIKNPLKRAFGKFMYEIMGFLLYIFFLFLIVVGYIACLFVFIH